MSFTTILRGIGGELKPAPAHTPPYAADLRLANAEHLANGGLRYAFHRADGDRIGLRYLHNAVAQPSRMSAMDNFVRLVGNVSFPRQIIEPAIRSVAVLMGDFIAWRRRLTQERSRNDAVQVHTPCAAINGQGNAEIVHKSATPRRLQDVPNWESGFSAFGGNGAPYLTMRAGLIVGRKRYRLPNFSGIVGISHGAVPSRGGQGRAVCPAPFRPANDSGFLLVRKAA